MVFENQENSVISFQNSLKSKVSDEFDDSSISLEKSTVLFRNGAFVNWFLIPTPDKINVELQTNHDNLSSFPLYQVYQRDNRKMEMIFHHFEQVSTSVTLQLFDIFFFV